MEQLKIDVAIKRQLTGQDKQDLLVRVVADLLTALVERDADQRFIQLYNDLKPLLESRLRRRSETAWVKDAS